MRKPVSQRLLPLLLILLTLALDRFTKALAVALPDERTLIPGILRWIYVENTGMAFSLLSGKQLFLIIATSIALIFVAYGLFFRSRGRYLQQAALLLILAGGIGNLIDRVLNGEVWTTSICCSCSLRCSILRISACVWAWASGCW